MSVRTVGYRQGEGRPLHAMRIDEGPASASAVGAIAALSRLALPGAPTGGAGPIERRQISEAEREIRREATTTQRSWNGRSPQSVGATFQRPAQPAPPQMPQEAAMPTTDPEIPNPFGALAGAAARAAEALDRKTAADAAWTIARDAVDAAYAVVVVAEDEAVPPDDGHVWQTLTIDVSGPRTNIPEAIPEAIPEPEPVAKPSQAERDAQSRRNGQASMQAQKRAAELTAAAARKSPKPQTRSAETRARMSAAMKASYARRKGAATS